MWSALAIVGVINEPYQDQGTRRWVTRLTLGDARIRQTLLRAGSIQDRLVRLRATRPVVVPRSRQSVPAGNLERHGHVADPSGASAEPCKSSQARRKIRHRALPISQKNFLAAVPSERGRTTNSHQTEVADKINPSAVTTTTALSSLPDQRKSVTPSMMSHNLKPVHRVAAGNSLRKSSVIKLVMLRRYCLRSS